MNRNESINAVNKALLWNFAWFFAFLLADTPYTLSSLVPKDKDYFLMLFFLGTICEGIGIAECLMLIKLIYLRFVLEDDITAYINGDEKVFLDEAETFLTARKFKPNNYLRHYGRD